MKLIDGMKNKLFIFLAFVTHTNSHILNRLF